MARKTPEKRQAILDAALDEFESKGFAASLVENIARRAGVSKGTIYGYFASKDALLVALADEMGCEITENMRAILAEPDMPLGRQIELMTQPILADNARRRPARILRVIWGEALHRPELLRPVFNRFLVPALSPESPLIAKLREAGAGEFLLRYPLALVAPVVQSVLWAGLVGNLIPVDFENYYREYLRELLGDRAIAFTAKDAGAQPRV